MKTLFPVEWSCFSRVVVLERLLEVRSDYASHVTIVTGSALVRTVWQSVLQHACGGAESFGMAGQIQGANGTISIRLVSLKDWVCGKHGFPVNVYMPLVLIDLEGCAEEHLASVITVPLADVGVRVLADAEQSREIISKLGCYLSSVEGLYCSASLAAPLSKLFRAQHSVAFSRMVSAVEEEFFPEPARILIGGAVCWTGSEHEMKRVYQQLSGRSEIRSLNEWTALRARLQEEAKRPVEGCIALQFSDKNGRWVEPCARSDFLSGAGERLFIHSLGDGVLYFSWLDFSGAPIERAVTESEVTASGLLPASRALISIAGRLMGVERIQRLDRALLMAPAQSEQGAPCLYRYVLGEGGTVRFSVFASELSEFCEVTSAAAMAPLQHFLENEPTYPPSLPVSGEVEAVDVNGLGFRILGYCHDGYELISCLGDRLFVAQHDLFSRYTVAYAQNLRVSCERQIARVRAGLGLSPLDGVEAREVPLEQAA